MPPFVHWPPSPSNSLEDDPLAVPDAGEVADGVEATAVCIAGPCDVDDPDKADVTDLQRQRELDTHLAAAHREQLPWTWGLDMLAHLYRHRGS